jgi:hypothetical protein
MNRRGHLSSKIPNVKLRPAPEARRRTRAEGPIATETTLWSDPEEDEGESY